MASFLALDWDQQQLHVVWATLRGGRIHIQRADAWKEEQSPNPAEAEALGRLLRERLKNGGIPLAPVLICVARDRVILKEIQYPPVPDFEEPAVVQFQVSKELTDALDEVVIDYARTGQTGKNGEQHALALVMRRELLTSYETLCRAAGLKLLALTPRPFGVIACWKHVAGTTPLVSPPGAAHAAVALLTVEENGAEFCIFHGDEVLLSRSLTAGTTLAAEIRRTLAVYAAQAPRYPVAAVYVAGGEEHAPFRARLSDLLGIPVHAMDPFAGVERPEIPLDSRGGFASAIGLLCARAQRSELPINFAKPKRPKPPSDPNKRRLVAAASLAAAFLVGSLVLCYGLLADKQRLVAEARILRDKADGQLTLLAEDANRIALLDEWNQGGIVWLDELYDLTARFPDPETIRLTALAGDPVTRSSAQIKRAARPVRNGNGSEEDQDKSVAKLALNGVTTEDDKAVDALNNRFVQDGHYHVAPKQTDPNTGTDKALFPQHFVAHVSIEKQAPDKYTRQLSVTADEDTGRERTDRRRNGGGRPGRGGRQ